MSEDGADSDREGPEQAPPADSSAGLADTERETDAVLAEPLAGAVRPRCMGNAASNFHEAFRSYVNAEMNKHFNVVEAACEASLQGGEHGVLVLGHCIARVDHRVPYGEIWNAEACPDKFPLDES